MKQQTKRAKNPDTPEAKAKYYITNSKLFPEVLRAKELGRVTNELAMMLMLLAKKYAQKPCFAGYTFKDDMISEALTNLCQNALKFNPEKSKNPFAYYTSCVHSSFLQFLNVEKRHRKIRDQLLVDIGENPSFNFIEENRVQSAGGEFKSELADLKGQIEEARERVKIEAARDAALKAEQLALTTSLLEFETIGKSDEPEIIIIEDEISEEDLTRSGQN